MSRLASCLLLCLGLTSISAHAEPALRGSGDLGVVIERADGSVQIVDTSQRAALGRIEGLEVAAAILIEADAALTR